MRIGRKLGNVIEQGWIRFSRLGVASQIIIFNVSLTYHLLSTILIKITRSSSLPPYGVPEKVSALNHG